MSILRRNIKLNHLHNVKVVHAALGSAAELHLGSSRNQIVSGLEAETTELVR